MGGPSLQGAPLLTSLSRACVLVGSGHSLADLLQPQHSSRVSCHLAKLQEREKKKRQDPKLVSLSHHKPSGRTKVQADSGAVGKAFSAPYFLWSPWMAARHRRLFSSSAFRVLSIDSAWPQGSLWLSYSQYPVPPNRLLSC